VFYKQKFPLNTKSNLKIQLSDFSKGINTKITQNLLPLNYAVNCYNFDFNKRSLSTGLGIKELSIPYNETGTKSFVSSDTVHQIYKFWQYTRYDKSTDSYVPLLIMYCDDDNLYYVRLKTDQVSFNAIGATFFGVPNGINYRTDDGDCFFACGEGKIVKYCGALPAVYDENVPRITSVALHAGRLFATVDGDQNVIWFSDDLNPTNWNVSKFEGGYIELTGERGVCKKVIEANNQLYIIREYGISRISGWGLQDDFAVKNMYLTTGKLYYETARLCGQIIIMLCSDGLYYFDGGTMNKINLGIEEMFVGVDNSKACGVFLDGKYYLACKLNYPDSEQIGCESSTYSNNTLIELDINTFEINILRGADVIYMDGIKYNNYSKLGILLNCLHGNRLYELTHSGDINGVATRKYWCSPTTDMGYPNYKKSIKYLSVNSSSNATIIFYADGKKYCFDVKGDSVPSRIPINIICSKFSVAFSCNSKECEISDPVLQVSLV